MLKKRIIPCLDMRDGRVVKGIQFENIRDAGDPVETARRYSQLGADEITFLDINATHEGRSTMFDVVERTAEQKPNVCVECGGVYNYSRDALCERCRNRKRREHEQMQKAAGAYRRREFYRKGKKQ